MRRSPMGIPCLSANRSRGRTLYTCACRATDSARLAHFAADEIEARAFGSKHLDVFARHISAIHAVGLIRTVRPALEVADRIGRHISSLHSTPPCRHAPELRPVHISPARFQRSSRSSPDATGATLVTTAWFGRAMRASAEISPGWDIPISTGEIVLRLKSQQPERAGQNDY